MPLTGSVPARRGPRGKAAYLAQICGKGTGIQHVGYSTFQQRAGKAVERGAGCGHRPDQSLRQRAVADAQSGNRVFANVPI